jgi:uncharacterized GH25 family protein
MAILIKANGRKKTVSPDNNTDFSLKELQKYVGGSIQMVQTKDDRVIVMNEEGKIKKLLPNKRATKLYEYGEYDYIVGDVLVVQKNQIK